MMNAKYEELLLNLEKECRNLLEATNGYYEGGAIKNKSEIVRTWHGLQIYLSDMRKIIDKIDNMKAYEESIKKKNLRVSFGISRIGKDITKEDAEAFVEKFEPGTEFNEQGIKFVDVEIKGGNLMGMAEIKDGYVADLIQRYCCEGISLGMNIKDKTLEVKAKPAKPSNVWIKEGSDVRRPVDKKLEVKTKPVKPEPPCNVLIHEASDVQRPAKRKK